MGLLVSACRSCASPIIEFICVWPDLRLVVCVYRCVGVCTVLLLDSSRGGSVMGGEVPGAFIPLLLTQHIFVFQELL